MQQNARWGCHSLAGAALQVEQARYGGGGKQVVGAPETHSGDRFPWWHVTQHTTKKRSRKHPSDSALVAATAGPTEPSRRRKPCQGFCVAWWGCRHPGDQDHADGRPPRTWEQPQSQPLREGVVPRALGGWTAVTVTWEAGPGSWTGNMRASSHLPSAPHHTNSEPVEKCFPIFPNTAMFFKSLLFCIFLSCMGLF